VAPIGIPRRGSLIPLIVFSGTEISTLV